MTSTLSLGDGSIIANGDKWSGGPFQVTSWNDGNLFGYDLLTPSRGGISFFAFEVTEGVTADDFFDWTFSSGVSGSLEVGWFGDEGSSTFFPENAYMAKINFAGEVVDSWSFSFRINREAVYGDAAWKDGGDNWALNAGFTLNDLDYAANHIVRPNGAVIPTPSAFVLAGIGFAILGTKRRRQLLS